MSRSPTRRRSRTRTRSRSRPRKRERNGHSRDRSDLDDFRDARRERDKRSRRDCDVLRFGRSEDNICRRDQDDSRDRRVRDNSGRRDPDYSRDREERHYGRRKDRNVHRHEGRINDKRDWDFRDKRARFNDRRRDRDDSSNKRERDYDIRKDRHDSAGRRERDSQDNRRDVDVEEKSKEEIEIMKIMGFSSFSNNNKFKYYVPDQMNMLPARRNYGDIGRNQEIHEARLPGNWESCTNTGIPSWVPESLLGEPRPHGWRPPVPEPVDWSVYPYIKEFDTETLQSSRFRIAEKEEFLWKKDIREVEPLVIADFQGGCWSISRTHLKGIIESKKMTEGNE